VNVLILSVLGALSGCAETNSCEAYVEAAATCSTTAGADASAYDQDVVCGEWKEEDEATYGAWYQCRAAAFDDGDCTTSEGLDAALAAAESCEQP
jgi:hypothetical protein